ncbi:transglutaminase-like domain-containing protein [Salinivirga cyanobacteriivorans]|uniref:Protein SirB1 N-terminal domain-containing protein n=1 Tax=Salinivirga cyanobacteriivorans TaxID=1307839 RepID=A0A0S2I4D6_9BACT|nr:transglutaminase-like domain-containing protein [Salinivirga cyanobacteriivorans]ALO17321.1 hypothetical protein L21SP5_03723 [Salinivirga cyanobacteriivorans]
MDNELLYLLKLMDDPSKEVFNAVESKVIDLGRDVIPDLERYWEKTANTLVQGRIENLLQKINFNYLKGQLRGWIPNSDYNAIYGSYLVSLLQYPDIDFEDISTLFEEVKRDLWLEMNPQLTALEKVRVINHILFQVHKFQGSRSNPTSPQHFFINNLLDTKRGNQYSLMMLYVSLAQAIDLPVYGVQLPHNYLLAYHDEALAKYTGKDKSGILFYINPYNSGAIFGKKELTQMLKQNKIEPRKQFYELADNVFLIAQVYRALLITFQNLGYTEKVERIEELLRFIAAEQSSHNKRSK